VLPFHTIRLRLLCVHVGALEKDFCAGHAVEELLGLAPVRLQLLARHLQRVDLQQAMSGVWCVV